MTERNEHDDALLRLLREHAPEPPIDDVDWQALHHTVTDRAEALLKRRVVTWWHVLGSPTTAVRALAAAAVLVLVLGAGLLMPERPATVAADTDFRTLEEELAGAQAAALLGGDREAALAALLLTGQEAW